MNKIFALILFSTGFLFSYCSEIDCDQLPKSYSSYEVAVKTIKSAHFKIHETVNTSKSSWVRGASYYSCDGISGFFILKTDNQEYIHADLPIEKWEGFKNANSFGGYYDQNIKRKYYFNLNQ